MSYVSHAFSFLYFIWYGQPARLHSAGHRCQSRARLPWRQFGRPTRMSRRRPRQPNGVVLRALPVRVCRGHLARHPRHGHGNRRRCPQPLLMVLFGDVTDAGGLSRISWRRLSEHHSHGVRRRRCRGDLLDCVLGAPARCSWNHVAAPREVLSRRAPQDLAYFDARQAREVAVL